MEQQLIINDPVLKNIPIVKPHNDKQEIIMVMNRVEMKYVLNKAQLDYLKIAILSYMQIDQYGKTTIASLYYDTPDYRLIRNSIEKPQYKEKIRLRSYGLAHSDTKVFLEIKRKVCGLVYKRRISLEEKDVENYLKCQNSISDKQIAKEICSFSSFYQNLVPAFLIIYDRVAYFDPNSDLRLTIDENPRYRVNELNLHTSMEGEPLLENEGAILEIKVQGAMPLWLSELLSKGKIYQSSFSKVGEAYQKEMLKSIERES